MILNENFLKEQIEKFKKIDGRKFYLLSKEKKIKRFLKNKEIAKISLGSLQIISTLKVCQINKNVFYKNFKIEFAKSKKTVTGSIFANGSLIF